MRACRLVLIASLAATTAVPASANIGKVKALSCIGSDTSFTIIFDHDAETAALTDAGGTSHYTYEQGDVFLTWRLVGEDKQPHYVIREGDAINGDLGWYFMGLSPAADGTIEMTPGGTCSPVD